MQTRRQVITAIIASAAAGLAAPAKPNFSGRWRLDPTRSSKDAPVDMTENIDDREPIVRIDSDWNRNVRTGVTNAAILAPTLQLKTDGTESTNDVPVDLTVVTKSHWDGDKLVTEWRLNGFNAPMSGTWTRYLTGPSAMVVDSIVESSGHRVTARFVFVK